MKIKDLAEIFTGYSFRNRLKNDPSGDTRVIQMGDVDRQKGVMVENLISIRGFNPRNKHYYLQSGDIIFVNKGHNLYAYQVPEISGKVIAINSFLIIKITSPAVTSGYLTWYLNSKRVQHYLRTISAGTTIPNVSIRALENLEVVIPLLDKQELISKIEGLKNREINILEDLKDKKENFIDLLLQREQDRWKTN